MAVTEDADGGREPPYDPETANPTMEVMVAYWSLYKDGIKAVSGEVVPEYAEAGRTIAIRHRTNENERVLVIGPSGLVTSLCGGKKTRIGNLKEARVLGPLDD